jgi:hypothetical protein
MENFIKISLSVIILFIAIADPINWKLKDDNHLSLHNDFNDCARYSLNFEDSRCYPYFSRSGKVR